jgi:hypothetical protein
VLGASRITLSAGRQPTPYLEIDDRHLTVPDISIIDPGSGQGHSSPKYPTLLIRVVKFLISGGKIIQNDKESRIFLDFSEEKKDLFEICLLRECLVLEQKPAMNKLSTCLSRYL